MTRKTTPNSALKAAPKSTRKPTAAQAPAPDAAPDAAFGFGRPPEGRRFRPGASGNPMGRPRRVAMAPPTPRRLIPADPTELELALAEPVLCLALDGSHTSLARAVVARLTERALVNGDVPACRELLRLCAEAEAVGVERAQLTAEHAAADLAAETARHEAETEAAAHLAKEQADRADDDAFHEIEALVEDAAIDAGQEKLAMDERALLLLDAADPDADGRPGGLKPWVLEAARAHDPALPRAADKRPLDLDDINDALRRLDIERHDEIGEHVLAAWFIDAAVARRPQVVFSRGDEALLLRVRMDDAEGEPDWAARLAGWVAKGRGSPSP